MLILHADPVSGASNILKLAKAFLLGMNQKLPVPAPNPKLQYRRSTDIPLEKRKIKIAKVRINPCRGCYVCLERTPDNCGVTDNMKKIIAMFLQAELVMWCFPMFYYGAPSIMKIFNEKLKPYALQAGSSKKRVLPASQKHIIVSVCSFNTEEKNYTKEIKQFDFLFEGKYHKIFCSQGELFNIPQMKPLTTKYLKFTKEAGAEYAAYGKITAKTIAQLSKPLLSGEDLIKIEKINKR